METLFVFCSQLEAVVSQEDPVVREVTSVLREWGVVWKNAYSVRICNIANRSITD